MPVILEDDVTVIQTRKEVSPRKAVFSREEGEELIRKISRLIKRQTNLGVQDMRVFIENGTVILAGYCRTFYTKQLAQEAALQLIGDVGLENRIRVA